jgi:hypothetical protein
MAYAATNPPRAIINMVGNGGHVWLYTHTDVHTDVDATNYFTDGLALGMKVNDVVIVVKTTTTIGATLHVVTEVSSDGATVAAAILS